MLHRHPRAQHWRPLDIRRALTPEFGFVEAWIVWTLRGALAALAIYSLAVTPRYTTRPLLVGSALAGLCISLLFAFIATTRPRTLKTVEAVVLAAFSLHVMGHTFGLYSIWPDYDKFLHFLVPLTIAGVLYALSQSTNWIWQWRRVTPLEVAIYCFAMVLAVGALWEIVEFGMDSVFLTQEQNGNTDTMLDLCLDALGALVGSMAVAFMTKFGRDHGFDRVAEEPKSDQPQLHFTKQDLERRS